MKKLKIIIISTLWETTPPKLYGGTERIASYLTEELVKRGHDVTLFATGDSKTKAKLISAYPRALYRDKIPWSNQHDNLVLCSKAVAHAHNNRFNIIHDHNIYSGLIFSNLSKVPIVHTIHGNISPQIIPPEKTRMLKAFKEANFISISQTQRQIKDLNYIATVYNGIPVSDFTFYKEGGDYLVWLGRISHRKGTKEAIAVARNLKLKLILAGKLDWDVTSDIDYYEKEVKPYLKKGQIEYIGEIDHQGKNELFKRAKVLLNLINWEEPFGLVPMEANACGVPVVATDYGAMKETIQNGVNGYIVEKSNLDQAIDKVKTIYSMNDTEYQSLRSTSRKHIEKNYTVEKMVDGYEEVYHQVISNK